MVKRDGHAVLQATGADRRFQRVMQFVLFGCAGGILRVHSGKQWCMGYEDETLSGIGRANTLIVMVNLTV